MDEQIGQMLMVGFRGLEVDQSHFVVRDIQERHLGSVVLFDYDAPTQRPRRNVASPSQVKALVASLQSFSSIPLLVAVDHEGGRITRLKEQHGFPATLSHQALGQINDLAATGEQARSMAQTLAELGINLNLAPVVDLCLNPDNPVIGRYERCFSADPQIVSDQALAFIRAHHEQGVLCTPKHFPGHGSSAEDSHRGWVDVTASWQETELEPYRQIIAAGRADAIMTAHVFNEHWDGADPATLSQAAISGMLRGMLGYDGVIISDDMQMRAIIEHYGFEIAIRKAIEAGVDLIVFANNSVYEENVVSRAAEAIRGLVEAGVLPPQRIAESARRIQQLKERLS